MPSFVGDVSQLAGYEDGSITELDLLEQDSWLQSQFSSQNTLLTVANTAQISGMWQTIQYDQETYAPDFSDIHNGFSSDIAVDELPPIYVAQSVGASGASGSAATVTFPIVPTQNDWIYVGLTVMNEANVITPPSGFMPEDSGTDGTIFALWKVYKKLAGASESTSYSFGISAADDWASAGVIIRGADLTTPLIAKTNTPKTTASTSVPAGPITYPANILQLMFAGVFGASATGSGNAQWTPDSSLTELVDANTPNAHIHAAAAYDTAAQSGISRTAISAVSSQGWGWIGAFQAPQAVSVIAVGSGQSSSSTNPKAIVTSTLAGNAQSSSSTNAQAIRQRRQGLGSPRQSLSVERLSARHHSRLVNPRAVQTPRRLLQPRQQAVLKARVTLQPASYSTLLQMVFQARSRHQLFERLANQPPRAQANL
jgi:hypothetical protein